MNIDYELIHRLVLEELAGVISNEDLAYLKKSIREDSEAFNVWFETRNILDTPDVKEFLNRPRSVDDIFKATITIKHRPPGSKGTWLFSLSFITILITCLYSFYFFQIPKSSFPTSIENQSQSYPVKYFRIWYSRFVEGYRLYKN